MLVAVQLANIGMALLAQLVMLLVRLVSDLQQVNATVAVMGIIGMEVIVSNVMLPVISV